MTTERFYNLNHIDDLLPAYVNGTLDLANTEQVQQHLLYCQLCRDELAIWEAMKNATQTASETEAIPSAAFMSQVWAKLDAPAQQQVAVAQRSWVAGMSRSMMRLWYIFMRQVPLIHKSLWIAPALIILCGCGLAILSLHHFFGPRNNAALILALFASVISAAGGAFIYGAEHDPGFEITLSTPTSIRLVMFCRMLVVIGYNIVLTALASAVLALLHGGGFGEIIHLWLGPMLLLASLSLMLSTLVGSAVAFLGSLLLEALQTFSVHLVGGIVTFQLAPNSMWQTSPLILALATLLIGCALVYIPRQPRLT